MCLPWKSRVAGPFTKARGSRGSKALFPGASNNTSEESWGTVDEEFDFHPGCWVQREKMTSPMSERPVRDDTTKR